LNECLNEANDLSQKMLNFYSYIVQFSEAKKMLPPISLNIAGPTIAEIKRLA